MVILALFLEEKLLSVSPLSKIPVVSFSYMGFIRLK